MNAPEPRNGFLVLTAINADDGAADSETFRVNATLSSDQGDDGPIERFYVTDAAGEDYIITSHAAGATPPEVRPYRELLRIMIDNDARYPGQHEWLSDLLAGASPELLALVEAER